MVHQRVQRVLAGLLCAIVLGWSSGVQAEPIPFQSLAADITAREQPIAGFLQDLFGKIGVRVAVSPTLKGAVNGRFEGTVEKVYRNIARAFNLVEYYDGSVLHVYSPQDMVSRSLPLDTAVAKRLLNTIEEMDMVDDRNKVRVAASGMLTASGTRRFVEQVEEMVRAQATDRRVEKNAAPTGFRVFYLRYAWAQDMSMSLGGRQVMLPGVASTVRAMMTSNPKSQVSTAPFEQPASPTVPRARGLNQARNATLGAPGADPQQASAAVLGATQSSDARKVRSPGSAAADPTDSPDAAVWSDSSQIRVEADARLNAVLVRDAPARMPIYEQLIAALDVEPQAIEIEATIIDVNTDKMRELGINWRYSANSGSVLLGAGDGSALPPVPTTPAGLAGGFISAVLGNGRQFISRINALQGQGAARVVSSPQVLTLSNVEAVFDNSQTFYVRVAGKDQVDLFNVAAGTTLRVTPHVFKDRDEVRIKMMVTIEDGSLSSRTVDTLPVVNRSSVSTQAMIFEGESLLVGGITRDSSSESTSKVPLLGDVPMVGGLFRNTQASAERIERMFLISPRLAGTRRAAVATGIANPTVSLPGGASADVPTPTATAQQVTGPSTTAPPVTVSANANKPVPPLPKLRVQDRRGQRETYARGEAYEVEVVNEEAGFLYCYLLEERRPPSQFFPNPKAKNSAVGAGSILHFPGPYGFSLVASRQGGKETVICANSSKDLGSTPSLPDGAVDLAAMKAQIERLVGGAPVQFGAFDVRAR